MKSGRWSMGTHVDGVRSSLISSWATRFCSLPVAAAALACALFTEPTAMAVQFSLVGLPTAEERDSWPRPGVVDGGATILVRGWALLSCIEPEVTAERRDQRINIRIRSVPAFCIAIFPLWQAYRAELVGLEPGVYRVHVSTSGHEESFGATVTVKR